MRFKLHKLFSLLCFWSMTQIAQAQTPAPPSGDDFFSSSGKIYVVVAVLGIILLGIFLFLISMDRRLRRLERQEEGDK